MTPGGRANRLKIRPLTLSLEAIVGVLILLSVQFMLLQARSVRAESTLDVCPGCTYEGIQEAIDAADPGDTIRVAQGVYTENLAITKSLTLLGGFESTGWARDLELYETTIDGNRNGSVISITNGCSTTIDGFTITGGHSSWGGGIYIEGSTATVTNNRLWDNMAAPVGPDFRMDEPLVEGDTVVTGIGAPIEPTWISLYDKTSGVHLGSSQIQADGRFTVTLSPPLVAGDTILALGAKCQEHEAVVYGGLGSDSAGRTAASGRPGEQDAGTEYLWAVEREARLAERKEQPGSRHLVGDAADDQDGSLWLGGGIYLIDSTAIIIGNEVVSNTALHFGGAIYAESSSVTMESNEIFDSRSGATFPCSWDYGYGGGVAIVGGSQFALTGNHIFENTILRGGGGLYITDSEGSLVGNEIVGNSSYYDSAIAYGGGIYVQGCSPRIEGNDILSNTLGTEEFPAFGCVFGGGIYLLGSSSLVTGNQIQANRVVYDLAFAGDWMRVQGGGIFAADVRVASNSCYHTRLYGAGIRPEIVGNHIEGNSAEEAGGSGEGAGGGLSSWGTEILLLDNEIVSNTAGFHGAGVSVYEHCYPGQNEIPVPVEVSGNLVMSNVLTMEGYGSVGGMSLGCITGTVQNNKVVGNRGWWVGGLHLYGPRVLVEGNHIEGNVGDIVAGVLCDGLGEVTFSENTVIGNVSSDGLGGIGVGSGSFVLSRNEVLSNTGADGGGIAVGSEATTVTLDANVIMGNRANERGGGILIYPDTLFTLTNNMIADNSAEEFGGGICISDSQGSLINNTIAQNERGAGEGIYLDGTAEATILNNVIVSHTYGIYNAGSGTSYVTYNDVWGDSVSDYFGVTPGVGSISSDPMFVDPGNWDYHLFLSSPAVNAGDPDESLAPSSDIDGDPRPLGGRVDMGADEVPFEVWVWKSDQPDPVLPGGLVTYTIRLSNLSQESYGGLVMTDRVPLNTTLQWASDDYEEAGGVVSWDVGSLGVGEQVTRTMVVEVDGGLSDGAVIENGEYGASSEEVTLPVLGMPVETRVGVPLLEISKTVYPDPVQAAGALTYTLVVTNNGGIRATGLLITDTVPEDTAFAWASDGGVESDGVASWSSPELGSGQSLGRTLVVTVSEGLADGTEIENGEYGVGCEEVAEPALGPPVGTLVAVPVLSIGKSAAPDPALPGEGLTYTIVVTNGGGWEATGLVITDRIPVDTTFYGASDGGELFDEVVSWTVGSVEPGHTVERTLVVTVSEGLSDNTLIHNDEYGVRGDEGTPVMGTPLSTLVGLPILSIDKGVEPGLAFPGEEVEYALTVSNDGHHQATGVVITDRVPLNAIFAWALEGGALVGDEVQWTGLSLEPGESVTVHWGATVTEDLLEAEVLNESYGALCAQAPEAVLGEELHTPILRYKTVYPLAVRHYLQ
jgi:uncharacterized repeat protein (TIGR01451 family)